MNPMPYPVSQSVALLVVSCDKYADLWSPFFDLFFRYWSDCPFPVYLLSNTTTAGIAGVREITVGPDVSWSDGLLQGLAQIQENYVFLFLDDLLLTRPVDTTAVETVLKWFISSQGNYIRLTGFPPPDADLTDMVGTVAAHTIYRTGTVLSVWRRQMLADLLRPGESAWEFETAGSVRSETHDGFYSTRRSYISVMNAVIKGKWQRKALRKTRSLCLGFEAGGRPVLNRREQAVLWVRILGNHLLYVVPVAWRKPIREFVIGRAACLPANGGLRIHR